MARFDVNVPAHGMTDVDCLITKWLCEPGHRVKEGEPIVEIDTGKVEVELESPQTGVLGEHLVAEGAEVPPGTVLTWVESET